MRTSTTFFLLLISSLLLACAPVQKKNDNSEIKPLVNEKHIGGDLYRNGRHIHHHPERK